MHLDRKLKRCKRPSSGTMTEWSFILGRGAEKAVGSHRGHPEGPALLCVLSIQSNKPTPTCDNTPASQSGFLASNYPECQQQPAHGPDRPSPGQSWALQILPAAAL